MILGEIKQYIAEHNEELTEIRRKLHNEPELSWEEHNTTQYVFNY